MTKITKSVIEECASNLLFDLGENQAELIEEEFSSILAQMDFLGQIKGIDDVEPMTFPIKSHQVIMSEDEPSTPLPAEEALKNTNNRLGNQVKIPKVVG